MLRLTIFDSEGPSLGELGPQGEKALQAKRRVYVLSVLKTIDQFNGLPEVAGIDGHDHIDGIEVFLTREAAGQIGFGIGGGVELRAQGTEKAEVSV